LGVIARVTVTPNLHLRRARGIGEQVEVKFVIAILKEGLLTPIAPLGHMMRDAGNDDSGKACHVVKLGEFGGYCNCHRNSATVTVIPELPGIGVPGIARAIA
jgi:hypothetical protein